MVLGGGRSLSTPSTKTDAFTRFRRADEELSGEEERYRGVLFSQLIFAVLPLGLFAGTVELLSGAVERPITFTLTAGLLVVCFLAALRMRRGNLRGPTAAVISSIIAACALSGVLGEPNRIWWAYMLIPVVLASNFVSLRGAVRTALVSGAVLVTVFIVGGGAAAEVVPPISFFLVVAPLLLFVAYHRDSLEEHRRAEALTTKLRLDRAERLAGVGHWAIEHDIVRLSPAARATLGTVRREITLDELAERMVDGREGLDAFFAARHSSMSWALVKYRRGGGAERFAVLTCADKDATPLLCTFQDTTEVMNERLEDERLRRQLHDAEHLEAIGKVVGGVAHDFNNLLTVLQASAEFIRECDGEDCQEYLAALDEAVERGQRLTRELVDSARGEGEGGG